MVDQVLLEDCITHLDGSALRAAFTHVESSLAEGQPDKLIPFPVGSNAWCFSVLILYKPWRSLYTKDLQPLLEPHQSAKDALIENGMICAECHTISVGRYPVQLKRCANCRVCYYCSSKCQRAHWKQGHKERCGGSEPFVVGDSDERGVRACIAEEMQICQQFTRQHPFPAHEKMFLVHQSLSLQEDSSTNKSIGPNSQHVISFYTRGLHEQVEELYQHLGKNSFEAKAVALGEYLNQVGGVDAMKSVHSLFSTLFHPTNDKEANMTVTAGTSGISFLNAAWGNIRDWAEQEPSFL